MVQGWLCFAATLLVVRMAFVSPSLGRYAGRLWNCMSERSLFWMLHANSTRDGRTLTRFGPGKLLVSQPKEAATGIFGFIGCSEDELRLRMARGVAAIAEEVEAMKDEVLSENFHYVVHVCAGWSELAFQNGWLRDRAPDGSELPGRHGMTLADFCSLDVALEAQLSEAHVVALRLYTTAAFAAINQPMRSLKTRRARPGEKADAKGRVPIEPPQLLEPHPLPVTMAFIYEGLKRMRAVSAGVHEPGSLREEVDGASEAVNNEASEVWMEPPVQDLLRPASTRRRTGILHPRENSPAYASFSQEQVRTIFHPCVPHRMPLHLLRPPASKATRHPRHLTRWAGRGAACAHSQALSAGGSALARPTTR
jgi:hypothetical protein